VTPRRSRVRSKYRHWATKFDDIDMGRRNFDGQVRTLSDACEAGYLVFVECGQCAGRKQMHPYKLLAKHKRLAKAPLGVELAGFRCGACRCSVSVTITCTYRRPGEM
jgi:hypothetical protein